MNAFVVILPSRCLIRTLSMSKMEAVCVHVSAFQETTAPYHAYFFIAVTAGTSPLGPWWIYALDYSPGTPNFTFDYPHVGFDNDAVQWTANNLQSGFTGAYLGTIAKSIIYNG